MSVANIAGQSSSTTTALTYPDVTVGELPAHMAVLYGDRPAVIDGARTLTYRQLDQQTQRIASALAARGVGHGDVVVLYLFNSVDFILAYYGSLRSGASVTLVNPLQPVAGLRAQIVETAARIGFTQAEQAPRLVEAGDTLEAIIVVDRAATAQTDPTDATIALAEFLEAPAHAGGVGTGASAGDIAHIAYTGGTTGVSKGVRVMHRNVIANVTQMIGWRAGHAVLVDDSAALRLEPRGEGPGRGVIPGEGATIVVSPLFHAHALINMSFLLLCGVTQVLAGRFDPGRMLELIEKHRATYITGSPAMWHALATHPDVATRDTSSVRVMSSGAAPIDPVTLRALSAGFPTAAVVEGYGLTEATCLVCSAPLSEGGDYRLGSVGLPTYDTDIEIREAGETGVSLPAGERGVLWVRGPQVTDGYLDHPEATAAQYVDGWLNTGDIAYRDDDGYVFICDRAKDMLIYKGYNVYPRELEDILVTHPAISAAAVVGRDAEAVGQEPVAFVVPKADQRIDADEVMSYVAEKVLPYKKIRDVMVIDALPVSSAGKIQKVRLREQVRGEHRDHTATR